MKHLLLAFAIVLSSALATAQCLETPQPRILLMGDSWAQFMNTDNTLNTALSRWGHTNARFYSNSVLSVNGTQTADFLTPAKLTEIQTRLAQYPSIDFVHLSLGGNDVLGNWDTTYTVQQTDSLLDSVYTRLVVLMDFIKQQRPGIQILWSGYCYPNFGEIIGELAIPSSQPFYATWQGMSFPTFTQINGILNLYSDAMDTLAANDPQVSFVKATGLMQYVYGQTSPLGVSPGGTYPPFTAPLPLGYPNYPSPKASMRNYGFFRDCFHLSPGGYLALADRHMQKFYHRAFMQDTALVAEGGPREGSSSSLSATSPLLQVGSANGEDWSVLVSFNTTTLPDTGIAGANLYLRRASLSGSNPFSNPGSVQLSISAGAIGVSADVDPNDFAAPVSATASPCVFGSSAADGDWLRIELPAALLPYIGNDSITQIRISVPASGGLMGLTGTADPDFAPLLDLKYGPSISTGIAFDAPQDGFDVYPNPTSGAVVITGNMTEMRGVRLIDLSGRVLGEWRGIVSLLSLESYPQGMYLLQLERASGIQTRRIVKR